MDARWSSQMAQYRQIMDDWKAKYLTGWRKEHELTEDLIVTRAVCNEVAEHIQHVRGNNPGAGLAARPEWYLSQVRNPVLSKSSTPPYFGKPKSAADFRPGASILYLRWVNKPPDPWNITRPLALTSGDDLVPVGEDAQSKIANTGAMYMRTTAVKVLDARGSVVDTRTDTQWLRWMHEATVVEVAETVDGPTVYTFETALPFDDKRQATIGVFKHSAAELRYAVSPSVMQGVLCGYEPDGNIPYARLQEKLNWNNILLRSQFSDAQLDGLWKAIAKPAAAPVSFAAGFADLAIMEAAPALKQRGYRPVVACLEPRGRKKKMRRYRPQVELPRGMQVTVDRGAGIRTEQDVYYPVIECRFEPRAAGLYLRAGDLLEIPEQGGSQPVRLKKDSALQGIARGGKDGSPVLRDADAFLPAGTRLRISMVHCAGPGDRGDGLIHAQDGEAYYMIVDCPRRISAQGLLVRADAVKAIPEKQYAKKALILT
jgi:hypothetical protein